MRRFIHFLGSAFFLLSFFKFYLSSELRKFSPNTYQVFRLHKIKQMFNDVNVYIIISCCKLKWLLAILMNYLMN